MSNPIEEGVSWLTKLLSLQGMNAEVKSEERNGDLGDDSYWLTIATDSLSEDQVKALIGDRGQVLDSMQYLANATLNMGRAEDQQHAYTLEISGYRQQRQGELKTMADEAAAQVKDSGEEYEMKGLSAAERRQLHGLLGEYEGLETFSRGREPERHLVVKLAGNETGNDIGNETGNDSAEETASDDEE